MVVDTIRGRHTCWAAFHSKNVNLFKQNVLSCVCLWDAGHELPYTVEMDTLELE